MTRGTSKMTDRQGTLFQIQYGPEEKDERSALIDPTGTYRYMLMRIVPPSTRRILWVMLNPSKADAFVDDPTIRKIVGFSTRAGFGEIVVVNLFAFRSKDPSDLKRAVEAGKDPVGNPECDIYISDQAAKAEMVVCAWGAHGSFMGRDVVVEELLRRWLPNTLHVLGFTTGGASKRPQPIHPLYQKNETPFVPWPR